MQTPTLYTYAKCDTCRRAVRWLREEGIEFHEKPIRETPPSAGELRAMLGYVGGDVRKLCNTSGVDYRAQGLGAKLAGMTEAEVVVLLAGNGSLVKRPFLIGDGWGLVGFSAEAWERALG